MKEMSLDKGEDEEKKKRENPGYQSYMHRQIVSIRNPKNEKKQKKTGIIPVQCIVKIGLSSP